MIISLEEIKCPVGFSEESFLLEIQKSFFSSKEGRRIVKDNNFKEDSGEIYITSDNIEIFRKLTQYNDKNNIVAQQGHLESSYCRNGLKR